MYKAGATTNVIKTDEISPKIIAMASVENIGSRPIQSGSIPPIVVTAVKNTGVTLDMAALYTSCLVFASPTDSRRITQLFVAIPTRHIYPKNVINPK